MSRFTVRGWVVLTIATALAGCGGGGDSGGSPTAPTNPSPATVTISIVTTADAQSYNPNPATQSQGATVAWRNNDGVVHRIVANDGSFDTGDIAPGATSRGVQPSASGTNYHCSIHPAMIGAIGSTQGAPPPPCSGEYC